jgi:hypothetical protein
VATGLKLMRMATIIKILVFVFAFLGGIAAFLLMGAAALAAIQSAGARGTQPPDDTAAGVGIAAMVLVGGGALILLLIYFVQYLLQIIGGIFCCRAPQDSGARGLAMGLAACIVFPIIVFLIAFAAGLAKVPVVGNLAQFVQFIAQIAEWVFFVLLLHKIGAALDNAELRSRAINFAIWIGIYVLTAFFTVCVVVGAMFMGFAAVFSAASERADGMGGSGSAASAGAMFYISIAIVGFVFLMLITVFLIMLIKYFGAINSAVRTIRQRLAGAALA